MKLIKQFLSGELPLWKLFWIFGILGKFFFFFLIAIILQALGNQGLFQQGVAIFASAVGMLFWIGEWRCALNTRYRLPGILMRIWLALSALAIMGRLLPHLPAVARLGLISLLAAGVIAMIGYYLFTTLRNFPRSQIFKRQNSNR
ncbi:MAG: hypothetical protein H6R07_3431 [Proteobacteria bacterium]|nr:hypothetical protein [Pseudomonadota bacterium]